MRPSRASKYEPLTDLLSACPAPEITLTHAQIEQVLGVPLPASATAPAWWHNRGLGYSHARAWLRAGWWVAGVDARTCAVTFVRVAAR